MRIAVSILFLTGLELLGQTTQGLLTGRVFQVNTNRGLPGAVIKYSRSAHGSLVETGAALANKQGYYALPFLSPGTYQISVDAGPKFQPQQINELELPVAARLEVDFGIRLLADVWQPSGNVFAPGSSAVIRYYAADVATMRSALVQFVPARSSPLEPTLSYVIDPRSVENLPLAGRDLYTTLLAQPGVTASLATGRGLGFSVNGQRSSSSYYLLDGIENNNQLLTGPLTVLAPEAIQEYRVSTNSYSAEYGKSAGFVANAITRSGSNTINGLLFGYLNTDALDANDFQRNAAGDGRVPRRELNFGFRAGGPIQKDHWFASSAYERFRSKATLDLNTYRVPSLDVFGRQYPQSAATRLLSELPTRTGPVEVSGLLATLKMAPTRTVERSVGLGRLDWVSPRSNRRLMFRAALGRGARPDFVFSPYRDLDSRLSEDSTSLAARYVASPARNLTNEIRAGWTNFDLHWNRPRPGIPTLWVAAGISMPGSELPYEFARRENLGEFSDTATWLKGNHVVTFGGALLVRRPDSLLSYNRDGFYLFNSLQDFAESRPREFTASVQYAGDEPPSALHQPAFARSYRNHQFDLFVQDNWRITRTLGISLGLRYESFGAIRNTGARDAALTAPSRVPPMLAIKDARYVPPGASSGVITGADRNAWAPRAGMNYTLGDTVFRGAFGIFYDRPYDNLLQNVRLNDVSRGFFFLERRVFDYLQPVPRAVNAALKLTGAQPGPPERFVWVADPLRSPRVRSWFAGAERRFGASLTGELTYMGAAGDRLITTDLVNRCADDYCDERLSPDPALYSLLAYRSNDGVSDYSALATMLRYRSARLEFQAAYTLSRSRDNQSDALFGELLDLDPASLRSNATPGRRATFTQEFNPALDYGNSDYDQRHNLVFSSVWEAPGPRSRRWRVPLGGWQFAQLAGFRSGYPVNIFANGGATFMNNRPDLVSAGYLQNEPIPGGVAFLRPSAFRAVSPADSRAGRLERNSVYGPGFWNVDLSVAKSFAVPTLGESTRIQFRADFFNVFNHANLGQPVGMLGATFGQALYGVSGQDTGFPAVAPLASQQRQIQLQLKLYF